MPKAVEGWHIEGAGGRGPGCPWMALMSLTDLCCFLASATLAW
jgi:hypothetical protein